VQQGDLAALPLREGLAPTVRCRFDLLNELTRRPPEPDYAVGILAAGYRELSLPGGLQRRCRHRATVGQGPMPGGAGPEVSAPTQAAG